MKTRVTIKRLRDTHRRGGCSFVRLNITTDDGKKSMVDVCPSCRTVSVIGPLNVFHRDVNSVQQMQPRQTLA